MYNNFYNSIADQEGFFFFFAWLGKKTIKVSYR